MNSAFDREKFETDIRAADTPERIDGVMASLDKDAMIEDDVRWIVAVLRRQTERLINRADNLERYGRIKYRLGVKPTNLQPTIAHSHPDDDTPPRAA